MARCGCVITNLKVPVTALYSTNLQISLGPVLRSVSAWQKRLQLSMEKRWAKKESLVSGRTESHLYPTYHLFDFIDLYEQDSESRVTQRVTACSCRTRAVPALAFLAQDDHTGECSFHFLTISWLEILHTGL